jgi:Na+-transporting methylmalonyl-CoA/oxaloacetate decarboxylase beta subunit
MKRGACMNKGESIKTVKLLTIIFASMTFISAVINFVVPMIFYYTFEQRRDTIGVIGTADGPTALILARELSPLLELMFVFAFFTVIGLIIIFISKLKNTLRRHVKKKNQEA